MQQSYLNKKKYFNNSVSDILGLFGLAKRDLDKKQATELVERYGFDNLDYYKLWKDKSFYFSKPLNAFIAYHNFADFMLALGDPVGDPKDIATLINDFKQYALSKKLNPGFFQSSEIYLDLYKRADFKIIKIGHESIIDVSNFDISNRAGLREHLRQLDSFRYKVRYYKKPTDTRLLEDLKRVSGEWLARGQEEKRFALGSFDIDSIKSSTVMTVEDVAGNVVAFTTLVPSTRPRELNIDLLRQAPAISVEALEFLITYTILFFKELDYERINLGMIPSLITESIRDNEILVQKSLMRKMNFLFVQPSLIEIKKSFADKLRPRYFIHL